MAGRLTLSDSLQGVGSDDSRGKSAQPATLERGSKLDRYVILEELGRGGMGIVYAAYDPELDRKVAVKLLRTDSVTARARLMREAKAVARLNHPHVVTVHDVGTVHGRVFLAMQLIEGLTLRKWIASQEPNWRETLRVLMRAGSGLAAAHAADLVHRDFKPENVLVDRNGHPMVLDFGIARRADTDSEALEFPETAGDEGSDHDPAGALTRADSVMGTPAYMAPEQHAKEETEARTDQFAFCVVAWEALFGQRPYAGTTAAEIAENVLSGTIREPPANSVPGRVRRVLTRGLSTTISARYPSMDRLLEDLGDDAGVVRRRRLVAGGGLLVVAVAAYVGFGSRESPVDPCAGARDRLEGVWDEARALDVEEAFMATAVPYAANAWIVVKAELDAWRSQWIEAHDSACRATHVHHEQSAEMLDLRMACLNRRLGEVAALTEIFARADGQVVQNSVVAVKSRGRIDSCADVEALTARVDPPADPDARERVARLHDRLAEAKAQELAGRYDDALRIADEVAAAGVELQYLPLLAEAHERLGAIWEGKGDYPRARRQLLEAIWAAEESRAEEVAADAWIRLVWVAGVEQVEPEQGKIWAEFARAALRRLGDDPFRQTTLTHNLGGVYYREGEFDLAFEHYERALGEQIETLGPQDPAVARTLNHIGNVLIEKGELERAYGYCERSLQLRGDVLGEGHPSVAASLNNMAAIRFRQERLDDAQALAKRALTVVGGSEGPEERVAWVLAGRIERARGEHAAAADAFRRALAIREAIHGREDERIVADLLDLARSQVAAGQTDPALASYERAAAITRGLARARVLLERVPFRVAGGDEKGARKDYEDALELLRADPDRGAVGGIEIEELGAAAAALGPGATDGAG